MTQYDQALVLRERPWVSKKSPQSPISVAEIKYTPLNRGDGDREIRLLQCSGRWLDEFRLQVVSLDSNYPSYVALSYCWGEGAVSTIDLNGAMVRISRSLYDALRSIADYWRRSSPARPLFIWCDQLCIDQQSYKEKNHQVRFMSEIYKYAEQVLVHLGSNTRHGLGGSLDLRGIERGTRPDLKEVPWLRGTIDHTRCEQDGFLGRKSRAVITPTHDPEPNVYIKAWKAMETILNCRWWTRVWIIQEYMFAFKAIFLFGRKSCHAEDFTGLFQTMNARRVELAKFLDKHMTGAPVLRSHNYDDRLYKLQDEELLRRICNSDEWDSVEFLIESRANIVAGSGRRSFIPLSKLLDHASYCGCTDPRDRVFAFASLIDPKYGIRVDYSPGNTWTNVCVAAVSAIIRQEKSLRHVLHDAALLCDPNPLDSDFPSWVPDYRGVVSKVYFHFWKHMKTRFVPCKAARERRRRVEFQSDRNGRPKREMVVSGSLVDILGNAIPPDDSDYWKWRRGDTTGKSFGVPSNVMRNDEVWVPRGVQYPVVVSRRQRVMFSVDMR